MAEVEAVVVELGEDLVVAHHHEPLDLTVDQRLQIRRTGPELGIQVEPLTVLEWRGIRSGTMSAGVNGA